MVSNINVCKGHSLLMHDELNIGFIYRTFNLYLYGHFFGKLIKIVLINVHKATVITQRVHLDLFLKTQWLKISENF